jgi:hypothetical protein
LISKQKTKNKSKKCTKKTKLCKELSKPPIEPFSQDSPGEFPRSLTDKNILLGSRVKKNPIPQDSRKINASLPLTLNSPTLSHHHLIIPCHITA